MNNALCIILAFAAADGTVSHTIAFPSGTGTTVNDDGNFVTVLDSAFHVCAVSFDDDGNVKDVKHPGSAVLRKHLAFIPVHLTAPRPGRFSVLGYYERAPKVQAMLPKVNAGTSEAPEAPSKGKGSK